MWKSIKTFGYKKIKQFKFYEEKVGSAHLDAREKKKYLDSVKISKYNITLWQSSYLLFCKGSLIQELILNFACDRGVLNRNIYE